MNILVTSDLHLSNRTWTHRPIEGDSYYAWDQIVTLAFDNGVEAVILAGDILDKQVNVSEPIHKLLEGVRKLTETGIKVYYNQGQHEYQESPWLQAATKAVWLHEQSTSFDGWQIAGCDYQNNEEKLKQFLKSELAKESSILVCHQVWRDFMGDMAKPQGCFNDIPPNVKYLITGDYHMNLIHHHGDLTVLSPGSTHMRSISEPVDKKVFLIKNYDRKYYTTEKLIIETLPLYSRRCIRLNATAAKGSWEVLRLMAEKELATAAAYAEDNVIPAEIAMPLLHLLHTSSDIELVGRFKQHFESKAHLFFKQKENKQFEVEEQGVQVVAGDRIGMMQCVDACISKSEKPLVHDLVLTLLQSPDPEQALQQWVKSHA